MNFEGLEIATTKHPQREQTYCYFLFRLLKALTGFCQEREPQGRERKLRLQI